MLANRHGGMFAACVLVTLAGQACQTAPVADTADAADPGDAAAMPVEGFNATAARLAKLEASMEQLSGKLDAVLSLLQQQQRGDGASSPIPTVGVL